MIDLEAAHALVEKMTHGQHVIEKLTRTTEWGWVLFYGEDESSATPVLIDKFEEKFIGIGKGPVEVYVDTYTKERKEIRAQIRGKGT